MSYETTLVIGVILALLSIPAMVSAFVDRRSPRRAAIAVLVAGGLILIAAGMDPDGFEFADVPNAFATVIRGIIQ